MIFHDVCKENGWSVSGDTATLPTSGDRTQTLEAQTVTEEGEEILRIHTVVGSAGVLDLQRLRSALSLNFRMRYGAIAVHDDQLVLVDTFLLADADAGEVKASMEYLARVADQQERLIYGGDQH